MTEATATHSASSGPWAFIFARRNRRALLNSVLLLLGYIGWYFTRSLITASSAHLIEVGLLSSASYGVAQAISLFFQLFSKLLSGAIVDYFNRPKVIFLIFGFISAIATVANSFWTTHVAFKTLYPLIKACSSFARVAALKILAVWYPREFFGTVASVIQMGSCVGEMLTRLVAGGLLKHVDFIKVCYICSTISATLFVPVILFVRATPRLAARHAKEAALESGAAPRPDTAAAAAAAAATETTAEKEVSSKADERMTLGHFFRNLLFPLLCIPKFYVIIFLSMVSTALRESITSWGPQYFAIVLGYPGSTTASLSAISGVAAFLSIFLGGYMLDKLSPRRKFIVPLAFLGLTFASVLTLYIATAFYVPRVASTAEGAAAGEVHGNPGTKWRAVIIVLINLTAFALSAPNSFFDGAYALDIAGHRAGALAAGIVSGFGYLGALVMNLCFKDNAATFTGWVGIWKWMTVLAAVTFAGGLLYAYCDYTDAVRAERKAAAATEKSTETAEAAPIRDTAAEAVAHTKEAPPAYIELKKM